MVKEGGGSGDKQSSSDIQRSSTQPQQPQHQQHQPSLPQRPQQQSRTSAAVATTSTSQPVHTQGERTHSGPQPPITTAASAVQQQHQHTTNPPGHQVIAVSASKGPAAFFNLARKFLATDEFCDLSALEGAIVSAVDAAHLLERSKLADIVRIQTSYVPVEPKRKSQQQHPDSSREPGFSAVAVGTATAPPHELQREGQANTSRRTHLGKKGAPLRRSRIIITVKRTNDYKQWLEENPYHASGHNDDIEDSPT